MKKIDFNYQKDNFIDKKTIKSKLYGFRVSKPDISIMIPTYLRVEYLSKAIISVLKQKTNYKFEIVVVDNNPDPLDNEVWELIKLINDERISYYKNEQNIGMFGNWNRCFELAQSDWTLILHDDDELEPDFIQKLLTIALKFEHTVGAVSCDYYLIDERSEKKSLCKKEKIIDYIFKNKIQKITLSDFYFYNYVRIWGTLFNTKKVVELGGFDEEFYPCSDTMFLTSFCKRFGIVKLQDKLFDYRWACNESKKINIQVQNIEFLDLLKKQINYELSIYSKKKDEWFRNLMTDLELKQLITSNKDTVSIEEVNMIKSRIGFDVLFSEDSIKEFSKINKRYMFRKYLRLVFGNCL